MARNRLTKQQRGALVVAYHAVNKIPGRPIRSTDGLSELARLRRFVEAIHGPLLRLLDEVMNSENDDLCAEVAADLMHAMFAALNKENDDGE